MNLVVIILACVGCLTLGMGLGILITELTRVKYLTTQVVEMKKVGFFPHYSISNEQEHDPTTEFRDF